MAGPWAGASTGTLSNVIWGLLIDPNALLWFPVALFIGLVAGICANYGLFMSWLRVIGAGIILAITAAIISTTIAVYLFGGITASGISFFTAYFLQTGQDLVSAVLSASFLWEPVDKIATSLVAYAIINGLSARYLARFPPRRKCCDLAPWRLS